MRDNSSSVEVNSCTFYNNAAQLGGAFYLETNNFSISNSILKNTASGIGQDLNLPSYTLSDLGHNLVYSTDGSHGITDGNGIDPKLDVWQTTVVIPKPTLCFAAVLLKIRE